MGFRQRCMARMLVMRQIPSPRSVGASRVMKIYCLSLPSYSHARRVAVDTAMVLLLIKACANRAQRVDLQTKMRQMSASSVRQAGIALQMVPPLRRHASYASRANMHPRRDPASAYNVPPVVPAVTMELLITFHAHRVDTIAFRVKPSV